MVQYPELHERFASKRGADRLSVRQQLDCNPYNQGCAGGYPYLISLWSFQNNMYSDKCYATAKKSEKHGKCQVGTAPACEDAFRVTTWRYMGGALGRCGMHHICEALIREELYKGGPMVVSIEPTAGFGYVDGVLHGVPGLTDKSLVSEAHSAKDNKDCKGAECFTWHKVDHSVLLVGFGEDLSHGETCQATLPMGPQNSVPIKECEALKTKTACVAKKGCAWKGFPFWTIQNSYGPGFGKDGYLSFGPRGQDPMWVESMAVGADVEWLRSAQGTPPSSSFISSQSPFMSNATWSKFLRSHRQTSLDPSSI